MYSVKCTQQFTFRDNPIKPLIHSVGYASASSAAIVCIEVKQQCTGMQVLFTSYGAGTVTVVL